MHLWLAGFHFLVDGVIGAEGEGILLCRRVDLDLAQSGQGSLPLSNRENKCPIIQSARECTTDRPTRYDTKGADRQFTDMLLLWFLTLCSVLIGASADIGHESLCYGSTFNLPARYTPPDFRGQLYFTPSVGGSRKLLMSDGEAKDPRLNVSLGSVRLTDLTERDNGTFSISLGDESTNNIITLTIDDCAEKITQHYGDIYGTTLPAGTDFVEFAPLHLLDRPRVVWNGTGLQRGGKVRVFFSHLELFRVTQADDGYYSFRKKDNTLLSRILLRVQEKTRRSEVWVKERLSILYPMSGVQWTVTFTPKGEVETQTWIEGNSLVAGDLSGRIWLLNNGIDIDVESTDSGTLEFRDPQGDLALTVEVTVIAEETDPTFIYVAPALVILSLVVVGCCCVKKFCFKKRSSSKNPAPQTAAAPAVYYHFQDTNPPAGPSYSAAPTTSALSSQPLTPPVSAEHSDGALVAAPAPSVGSEPPSSDPEPRFDLKEFGTPRAISGSKPVTEARSSTRT